MYPPVGVPGPITVDLRRSARSDDKITTHTLVTFIVTQYCEVRAKLRPECSAQAVLRATLRLSYAERIRFLDTVDST